MKDPRKIKEIKAKPTSPLDIFFSLGDKVTKGDPKRKADFDYYMLWIIFLAFFLVLIGNIRNFVIYGNIASIGWSVFALAIMWFQYSNLKGMWMMRKMQKEQEIKVEETDKIEEVDEMLKGFAKDERTK